MSGPSFERLIAPSAISGVPTEPAARSGFGNVPLRAPPASTPSIEPGRPARRSPFSPLSPVALGAVGRCRPSRRGAVVAVVALGAVPFRRCRPSSPRSPFAPLPDSLSPVALRARETGRAGRAVDPVRAAPPSPGGAGRARRAVDPGRAGAALAAPPACPPRCRLLPPLALAVEGDRHLRGAAARGRVHDPQPAGVLADAAVHHVPGAGATVGRYGRDGRPAERDEQREQRDGLATEEREHADAHGTAFRRSDGNGTAPIDRAAAGREWPQAAAGSGSGKSVRNARPARGRRRSAGRCRRAAGGRGRRRAARRGRP